MSDFAFENYLGNHDPEPVECEDCEGTGRWEEPDREDGGIDCDTCDGAGVVEP